MGLHLHARLRLMFLARYSVLTAAGLVAIFPVAKYVNPELLYNLFVLDRPWQLFHVTWLALLATALALVTFRITEVNAAARFSDYANAGPVPLADHGWRLRWLLLFVIGAVIPVACLRVTAADPPRPWIDQAGSTPPLVIGLAMVVLGTLVGLALLAVLTAIQQLLLHPDEDSPHFLPFERFPLCRLLKRVRLPWLYVIGDTLVTVLERFGPGYVQTVVDRSEPRPRERKILAPGHASLALWLGVILAAYLYGFERIFVRRDIPNEDGSFAAIFFLLLLFLLVGTILPGMAFFLDYYRLPVTVLLGLISLAMYLFADTDHYYELKPKRQKAVAGDHPAVPLSLTTVFDDWQFHRHEDGKRTMVVVTAAGGGIQAAVWTARVLAALDEMFGPEFTRSIGMISGVSGGSVGAMYYIADGDWTRAAPYDAARRRRLVEDCGRSSLEAVAWGIVYPDLMRPFVPFLVPRYLDRGWAIEHAWQARLGPRHRDMRVSDWVEPVRQKKMPVVVFNATLVETGQRLLIAPVIANPTPNSACDAREFFQLYPPPEADPRVTTAVRLSATFPYVSPVSRPNRHGAALAKDYHVADGAYADSEGVFTAMDWIDRLVDHYNEPEYRAKRPFDRVLLIRIQPFPIADTPVEAEGGRGWTFEALGPLETIQNVRTASQAERNNFGLRMLSTALSTNQKSQLERAKGATAAYKNMLANEERRARDKDANSPTTDAAERAREIQENLDRLRKVSEDREDESDDIEILWTAFTFQHEPQYIPPMSWRMSPSQKEHIEVGWQAILQGSSGAEDWAPSPNQFDENPLTTLQRFFTARSKEVAR